MCELITDDWDLIAVASERQVKRCRKDHVCDCCKAAIPKGSSYMRGFYRCSDGHFWAEVWCMACEVDKKLFQDAHGVCLTGAVFFADVLEECVDLDGPDADPRWVAAAGRIGKSRRAA